VIAVCSFFAGCKCLCHVCIISSKSPPVNKDPPNDLCSKYNKTGTPKTAIIHT
jgi:hypothetical protein